MKQAADKTTQAPSGNGNPPLTSSFDPKSTNSGQKKGSGADSGFTASRIALDFADTTWRIAVPVVIFALIGIFVDNSLDTAPWLTLLGVVIGFGFAVSLIKKQLDAVQRREGKS